jgi:hypothetical protein
MINLPKLHEVAGPNTSKYGECCMPSTRVTARQLRPLLKPEGLEGAETEQNPKNPNILAP